LASPLIIIYLLHSEDRPGTRMFHIF
jgi:hypothetical protein